MNILKIKKKNLIMVLIYFLCCLFIVLRFWIVINVKRENLIYINFFVMLMFLNLIINELYMNFVKFLRYCDIDF